MISVKEVEKTAQLAKIKLTAAEKKKLQKDLSFVLDYIGQLSELDTGQVEPVTNIGKAVNAWRADEPTEKSSAPVKEMVDQFPSKQNDFAKVKAVMK